MSDELNSNEVGILEEKQITIPAKQLTKLVIVERRVNYKEKIVQIAFEQQTSEGKSGTKEILKLIDSPPMLDENDKVIEEALTGWTDWITSVKKPENRDKDALTAAGVL